MENETGLNFYNTIAISGEPLKDAETKAKSQQKIVLDFFTENKGKSFTPYEVYCNLINAGKITQLTPITSIRRAINNLTLECHIQKTTKKRPGLYKQLNLTWEKC